MSLRLFSQGCILLVANTGRTLCQSPCTHSAGSLTPVSRVEHTFRVACLTLELRPVRCSNDGVHFNQPKPTWPLKSPL